MLNQTGLNFSKNNFSKIKNFNLLIFVKLINDNFHIKNYSKEDKSILNEIKNRINDHGELPFNWGPQELNYILKNTEDKWLDYLIYRYKFILYPKLKIKSDFPIYILIEPTSICNLRCTMCFQVDKSFTKKEYMGQMEFDLFKKIVDEAVINGTKAITLASRGEPTLHKQLNSMLDYISNKFIDIKLNTNATKLNDDLCHKILSSSVNEIVFSVDSHIKTIYEKIRVNGVFEDILYNIKNFHSIRKNYYPNSKIITRISGVRFLKEQNMEMFEKFWGEICDEVAYVDIENRWDTYNNNIEEINSPCNYLWERFYIWWDGKCNPCDVDYKSQLSPGNINNNTIKDIWNSFYYEELRKKHISSMRNNYVPCDRCGVSFE
jgi:radical SAM protein with 4Fe4S-binding SPASM domain